jgi:hypothetical protein
VQKQGQFVETYTFPLKYTKEFFYCSGNLTSMPMGSFNSIVKANKGLIIENGQLDSCSFSFMANEKFSKGIMKFVYHGLNVKMLNEHDNKTGIKQKLKTLIVNKFVIEDSNPGKDNVLRISKIHAEHNPYRFFINYSMLSVVSGIEPAIVGKETTKWLNKK